jgi:hypothetical protein
LVVSPTTGIGTFCLAIQKPDARVLFSLSDRKSVTEASADITLSFADSAWPELAAGLRSAYQRGLVRIDGKMALVAAVTTVIEGLGGAA